MGGKSGGGQSTPYEAPNTLSSAQSLRIVDAISEGVIYGFANGNDAPFKSIYFDDTPVQNADGSFNFKGVSGFFQRGEQNQSYMPGFDSSERTVAVSANVKKATPIVRAVTDNLVNRLRVTVGVERNAQVHDNGDTRPATTVMLIELVNAQGVQHSQTVTFTEKSSGSYYHDVLFDRLPQPPFNIRVTRQSDDSTSDKLSNNTFFASYVEIIDVKLSFPNTAVAAYSIDSDQFGNRVPRRNALVKGLLVNVPSNYNPDTRAYSTPVWDGAFKKAWTNNPSWIFYDLCRQPRYSTLARRLKVADIDKWTLYEIGKYCDELVDDGFGGKEPRFVCNAYITDRRPAGELLSDLASVFTGMAMWNGHQLSVMMDVDSDPVAIYNNANVVNGEFTYSSAALKSIHTAVHVQYIDKNDGYRTKTEYIADDAAIARYGLNIKQVTAFGCDSRGQAARYGAWVLETELRQQHTVSFTVGREGLKHLPFDVVQVMDNQYAGAEVSGRIAAVSGTTITLDRDVDNAVGAMLHYTDADGFKSVKVTGQPSRNKLTLAGAVALSENDVWVLSAKVKPRLYRAISITENTDDGTYTVSALLHDPKKYADVDTAANFDRDITTLHTLEPVLLNADVKTENGALILTWDNLTVSGQVLSYDIKIYRNNQLYRHTPDATTPEIRLENLPNGDYRAEIRGRNARGVLSEALVKAWSINYTVTGLRTTPKTLSIDLAWVVPTLDVSGLSSEVWYSRENNIQTATKLTTLAYPQNAYTLTGVSVTDTFYFWVRMVDENGNTGEYTAAVEGRADNDPAPIVAQMQGAITKSALSQSLLEQLNSDMDEAAADAVASEAQARTQALQAEADARTKAIQAEQAARTAAVKAAADKAAGDLLAKSNELGTRITATENVNKTQAQQISTVTAAQGQTAAGLEAERKARADGDLAEAQARETLAARVGNSEGAINEEKRVRAEADRVQAEKTAQLTSRVAGAEGGITALQKTVADNDQARTEESKQLTARFDNMSVGGRNLLLDTSKGLVGQGAQSYRNQTYAFTPNVELSTLETIVLSCDVATKGIVAGENYRIGVEIQLFYEDGTDGWLSVYRNNPADFEGRLKKTLTLPKKLSGLTYNKVQVRGVVDGQWSVNAAKLERGNVGTDWSPAPEDLETGNATTLAELNAFKVAQATKDEAQTTELNTAKAAIAGNAAEIQNLKTTKADSSQIVATARAGLQAEWESSAVQAQAAAAADAQRKADAAKTAAIAAADTAAKAKADAAQAAAIAAASGDAASKANAAKAAAIADAAAKDAVVKQQAAADAKTKADAALAAAKAYADQSIAPISAKVTSLEQTSVTVQQAEAIATGVVSAKFQTPDTRNDNQPPTWYWANYPKQTASEFKNVSVMSLGSSGFCVVQTVVPWSNASGGAITQSAYLSDGRVMRRKSDTEHTYADGVYTYSKDTWTSWVADETVVGAQAKADAVKLIADAANALAIQTDADFKQFARTYTTDKQALAERQETLSARFDALSVGGRNLLRDSNVSMQHSYLRRYQITQAPKVGDVVTVTVWGELGATRNGNIGVYNSYGTGMLFILKKVKDGVYRGTGTWAYHTGPTDAAQDTYLNLYAFPDNGATNDNRFDMVKLEIGTVPTDWTPAPEDAETKAAATEAALNEFKSAQATKDTATTRRIDGAVSRIGDAEAKLTTTQQTIAGLDGKVQSLYTLKAETLSGGRKAVSALMMGADGQTADSQILLMADKVGFVQPNTKQIVPMMTVTPQGMALNGNLVADGTVLGRHLAAQITVEAPKINGGEMSATSFNGGNINIGNGNFVVDWLGNLYAKNGRFDGTVTATKIEGYLIEGISATREDLTSTTHNGYIDATARYTFIKTDNRAARIVFDTFLRLVNSNGRAYNSRIYATVYINGSVAPNGTFMYNNSLGDKHYHAWSDIGNLFMPSFELPSGNVIVHIEMGGISNTGASEVYAMVVPTSKTATALLVYK